MTDSIKIGAGVVLALLALFLCARREHAPAPATSETAAVAAPASLGVEYGERIRLYGTLPREELRNAVRRRAEQLYGGRPVIDEVLIDPAARGSWVETDALYLPLQSAQLGKSNFNGEVLEIAGELADQATRERVLAEARSGLGGQYRLADQTRLRPVPPVQAKLSDFLQRQSVEFNSGSTTLTARGRQTLDEVARIIAAAPGTRFDVVGHTDNVGDPRENRILSLGRARAAVDYLVAVGLGRDRFVVKGYGDEKPIASNDTDEGRQTNRRIEFVQIGE
ncbi:MAG: OmpA family protein [Steroidobacteraceae bacterium]